MQEAVNRRTGTCRRYRRWAALMLCVSLLLHLLLIGLLPPPVEALEGAASVLQVRLTPKPQPAMLVPALTPQPPETELPAETAPPRKEAAKQTDRLPQTPAPHTASAPPPRRPEQKPAQQPAGGKAEEAAKELAPATTTMPAADSDTELITTTGSSSTVPKTGSGAAGTEDKPSRGPVADPGNSSPQPSAEPAEKPAPAVDVKALLKTYGAGVLAKIRTRQVMPAEAERLRLNGSVRVVIRIEDSGELLDVSISDSSGHSVLDEAALKAVRDAAPFEELPAESGRKYAEYKFLLEYEVTE